MTNHTLSPLAGRLTRGQRNCNPLNIRRSGSTRWLGQATEQQDREFVQFRAMLFGLRAAFRILRTYIRLHQLDTVRLIIYRWAPPEDGNNTEAYIRTVCERSGLQAGERLSFADETRMRALVRAMAWVESREDSLDDELLHQAYLLAL